MSAALAVHTDVPEMRAGDFFLDDALRFVEADGAAAERAEPVVVHFVVRADDAPALARDLELVVAVARLELDLENGDAVLAVALDLDVVGVPLRHSRVLQSDGERLLASNLRALRRNGPRAHDQCEAKSEARDGHFYFHDTFLPDGIVVSI